MAERWTRHTVTTEEAGTTVGALLTEVLGVSRRRIQKLTRSRGIELNRRPAFLGRRVREGDVVSVREAADEAPVLEAVPMELSIVYEDADLLVVDKPPFLLVHPTSPLQRRTLAHGIAHHFEQQGIRARVRPVHRLDRDTSGLVLIARTPGVHARLDRRLREGGIRRVYKAWVEGVPDAAGGLIDAPIGRDPRDARRRRVDPSGEPARTRFRVEQRFADAARLEIELDTGRTHQIRVHLADLGHPVLGDTVYGGREVAGLRRQALHASRLAFEHPASGERLELAAPLPPDLAALETRLSD